MLADLLGGIATALFCLVIAGGLYAYYCDKDHPRQRARRAAARRRAKEPSKEQRELLEHEAKSS